MSQQSIDEIINGLIAHGSIVVAQALAEEVTFDFVAKPIKAKEAKSSLLELILSCIGEDEPFKFKNGNAIPMIVEEAWKNGRNQLRAEIRNNIRKKFGAL